VAKLPDLTMTVHVRLDSDLAREIRRHARRAGIKAALLVAIPTLISGLVFLWWMR
jgi:ABC-type uncharacterized transport system involved in gliding motility auxiliary subunit